MRCAVCCEKSELTKLFLSLEDVWVSRPGRVLKSTGSMYFIHWRRIDYTLGDVLIHYIGIKSFEIFEVLFGICYYET